MSNIERLAEVLQNLRVLGIQPTRENLLANTRMSMADLDIAFKGLLEVGIIVKVTTE